MGAQYVLIRSVEPTSPLDGLAVMADPLAIKHGEEDRAAVAQADLDRLAERLRAGRLQVQTQVVVGEAAASIVDAARREKIDLIAVATHGRGGLTRFVLGSVADKIVRNTFIPVLVYRPPAGATAERTSSATMTRPGGRSG
jgi:nucleotide-binding universal stress UspA family protein